MNRLLELSTGCRLHFGLLELAEGQPNRYGGLGLMLESPKLRVRLREISANALPVVAPSVEVERRVQIARSHALSAIASKCSNKALTELGATESGVMEVVECPPLHSGLGVGTQLGTAVAQLTALSLGDQMAVTGPECENDVARLAWLSGRGKRSAIGLHGFLHGGLVRDLGYDLTNACGERAVRPVQTLSVRLPSDWMVVLCCSRNSGEVHGQLEEQLMDRAAAKANSERERMLVLSDQAMTAATSDDFHGFVQVLDEYMELASRLFANVQSGRYRDAQITRRVEQLKATGLNAVGQSSWGPTVFGFASNSDRAHAAADQLSRSLDMSEVRIIVTRPKSSGAQWSITSTSSFGGKQHAG